MEFIKLYYNFPTNEEGNLDKSCLERIIEITTGLKTWMQFTKRKYPDTKLTVSLLMENYRKTYKADMRVKKKKGFDKVVSNFLEICGLPDEIEGGTKFTNNVLKKYEKRLKGMLPWVSRAVVDI